MLWSYFILCLCEMTVVMPWCKMEKLRGKYCQVGMAPRGWGAGSSNSQVKGSTGQWLPDRRKKTQKWRPAMEIVTLNCAKVQPYRLRPTGPLKTDPSHFTWHPNSSEEAVWPTTHTRRTFHHIQENLPKRKEKRDTEFIEFLSGSCLILCPAA